MTIYAGLGPNDNLCVIRDENDFLQTLGQKYKRISLQTTRFLQVSSNFVNLYEYWLVYIIVQMARHRRRVVNLILIKNKE